MTSKQFVYTQSGWIPSVAQRLVNNSELMHINIHIKNCNVHKMSVNRQNQMQRSSWPGGSRGPDPPWAARGVQAKRKNPVIIFFVRGWVGGLGSRWWRTRPDPPEPSDPPTPLAKSALIHVEGFTTIHFGTLPLNARNITCITGSTKY